MNWVGRFASAGAVLTACALLLVACPFVEDRYRIEGPDAATASDAKSDESHDSSNEASVEADGSQTSSCADGIKNGDETDIDCGGSCNKCPTGSTCLRPEDCGSAMCVGGKCYPIQCGDGRLNGRESDLDCGGGSCPACPTGSKCRVPEDCVSGECLNAVCG